jgi:hypothetical protein
MADKDKEKEVQPQQVVVVQPNNAAPAPTEGLLQPVDAETAEKDPNAKPTYIVDGREVDPDGNPVGKDKK